MKVKAIILLLFLTSFIELFACFWDKDTLEMEKQQFPDVVELISGKFLRHSEAYHQWRIKDREAKIKKHPTQVDLYDDLAVSYSKVHNDPKAIEIILKKDKIEPGLYTTYANLGTFYLHNRQFQKGIESIDKAIEINPDAHFGREIYQRHLAEYILSKMKNGKIPLPLDTVSFRSAFFGEGPTKNFYAFLSKKYPPAPGGSKASRGEKLSIEETKKAVEGIKGMMKFGNYNSPILLEVLGDLLINSGWYEGARQLAARAYLKASYEVNDEKAKRIYRNRAQDILREQQLKTKGKHIFKFVEDQLKLEIDSGNAFFEEIKQNELNWIESGSNAEFEFDKKYYKDTTALKVEMLAKDSVETLPEENTNTATPVVESNLRYYVIFGSILSIAIIFLWIMKKNKH